MRNVLSCIAPMSNRELLYIFSDVNCRVSGWWWTASIATDRRTLCVIRLHAPMCDAATCPKALMWLSAIVFDHVLQDPQYLCIGEVCTATVCTCLCMYASLHLQRWPGGCTWGWLRVVAHGRCRVGPTYEVDRGSKHVFEHHRTSGIHWC